ncbi:uncharacterized protein LOC126837063 [Adelges cooleyi]|uniref:uncharacterized protein LOC126837063 n=1 Tax=Adelges cooleyi TaxID=133065 RepID=UPI00218086A4|nr:uncharacterized protein LOC126837063 [Adelges cooleyi]
MGDNAETQPNPDDQNDEAAVSPFSKEAYVCDRQYAIVLAQLISVNEREKVYKWIERLDKMTECDEVLEERAMYLRFLTLSLKNGKLVSPFTKLPPPSLRPLSVVMPRSVHNLVFKEKLATGADCPPTEDTTTKRYCPPDEIEPKLFFSRQPMPRNGVLSYAAAFSTK